jgi:PAS domain S-box-containing protein
MAENQRCQTTSSGQPQRFAWHCRAKDGDLFWAEISLRSAVIGGRTVVLVIMRDMTEQRSAEAQSR